MESVPKMKHWLENIHLFNLVAFLAVLVALIVLALAGKATDLAIMTGLIGILGSFKPWGSSPVGGTQDVNVTNTDEERIPVEGVKK